MGYALSKKYQKTRKKRFRVNILIRESGAPTFINFRAMDHWIKENCKGGYFYEKVYYKNNKVYIPFLFVRENDAVLFKLHFG